MIDLHFSKQNDADDATHNHSFHLVESCKGIEVSKKVGINVVYSLVMKLNSTDKYTDLVKAGRGGWGYDV